MTPHTAIACAGLQPGVGGGYRWQVAAGGSVGPLSSSAVPRFSCAPPQLLEVPGSGTRNMVTTGGTTARLRGVNFGPPPPVGQDVGVVVAYAASGNTYTATGCRVLSQTEVTCLTAPGSGLNHTWQLSIAGQPAPPLVAATSYAGPIIFGYRVDTLVM